MTDNCRSHNRNTMAENWTTEILCRITGEQKYYAEYWRTEIVFQTTRQQNTMSDN